MAKETQRSANSVARVHAALREMAIRYELKPGERVKEAALAERLKVSRTPVREALNRLVTEGLLLFEPNKGFTNRPLDLKEIRDLYELRQGLEATAARLAAARAEDTAVEALQADWAKTAKAKLSAAQFAARDEAFHEAIAGLSGNAELAKALQAVNARIRFFRQISIERPPLKARTFDEHAAILEAIAAGRGDDAARRMGAHVELSLEDTAAIVKEGKARIGGEGQAAAAD